ncbi:MAG: transcriptional repressor [Candidatus Dojkabacteria bacterium]
MKITKNQKQIINLFSEGKLLKAHEIVEQLSDIDRATIFRNLNKLVDEGILTPLNVSKGSLTYELLELEHKHLHFICNNCEKIQHIEVNSNILKNIIPEGVQLEDFELNLKGKCEDCRD